MKTGKTAIVALAAFGFTISAVGGYSNARPRGAVAHRSGEFTTVGIVTQATGDAYWMDAKKKKKERLAAGIGVSVGTIWVDEASQICLVSVDGVHYDISGPAVLETTPGAKVHVLKGVVLVRPDASSMKLGVRAKSADLTSPFATIHLDLGCESLVVALPKQTQVAAWIPEGQADVHDPAGEPHRDSNACASVSHFNQPETPVKLASMEYTEVKPGQKELAPEAPKKFVITSLAEYLETRMDYAPEIKEPVRAIASQDEAETEELASAPESPSVAVTMPGYVGSSRKVDLEEPKNDKAIALLAQKYSGNIEEEVKERKIASLAQSGGKAAKKKTKVDILQKGHKLDADQIDLIRKLQNL